MKTFVAWFLALNGIVLAGFLIWLYALMWIHAWVFMAVLHYLFLLIICVVNYD